MEDKHLLSPEVTDRWIAAAKVFQIPEEAYRPKARVITDPSGRSDYSFGAILNPHRSKRPLDALKNKLDCPLCGAVEDAREDPIRDLDPESGLEEFTVIANIFPTVLGHSMAVTSGTEQRERPMYNTANLAGVAEEMRNVFDYCSKVGFRAFHNGEGSGASIPNHEHWHFTNWHEAFLAAGSHYGFENASTSKLGAGGTLKMEGFPFAHAIFRENDPERIIHTLGELHKSIGDSYDNGVVPHVVCQGKQGILVVPFRTYSNKGIGSGDVAGHAVFKDLASYEDATYKGCVQILNKRLFRKEDLDIGRFL